MTRSARVTVRLQGARTAPATNARTRFQTGAVKHGRNTASHNTRTGGTTAAGLIDSMRSGVI
jgi:hypothetical protein